MATSFSVDAVFRVIDRMTRPIRRMQGRMGRFVGEVRGGFRDLGRWGARIRRAYLGVAAAVVAATAAVAAGLRRVIETGMDFDTAITSAAAKFPGELRRGSEAFAELEEAAQRVGSATEFTATQAAQALDFLAMAGFDAEQAIAALPGVVDLATASQMELAEASDIASDTLGAFGLMTRDTAQLGTNLARVNDVLARTSTSANTTVEEMFEAIRTGGGVAHSAGASIETFSAMLGELGNAGVKGAEAGTALRNVFLRLQNPATAARRHIRRLGIQMVDDQGNFRDIIDIMGQFEQRLSGMGTAERGRILGDVFGAESVNAVNLLLQSGAQRLNDYRTSLEQAEGASAAMAATMRDTAGGDLASMNSAIEGFSLQIWALIRGPVRGVIQAVTEWVRANQGVISSGIEDVIQFLTANMPTIEVWARRIGIAVAIVGTLLLLTMAAFVAVIVAIPALIVGVVSLLVAAWEWVADAASSAAAWIGEAFGGVWNAVRDFFGAALEFVVGIFVLLRRQAMTLLRPVIDWLASAGAWIAERWRPIGAFFGGLWAGIASAFSGAWDGLVKQAVAIYSRFLAIWRPLRGFFASLWSGIAQLFHGTLGGVLDQVGRVVENVRGVGRAELDGDAPPPSVVSPEARVARSISESTSTERAEITVRSGDGATAEVTRRPRGNTLLVPASGAT